MDWELRAPLAALKAIGEIARLMCGNACDAKLSQSLLKQIAIAGRFSRGVRLRHWRSARDLGATSYDGEEAEAGANEGIVTRPPMVIAREVMQTLWWQGLSLR